MYYILYAFLYLLSLLPMAVLYILSDTVYLLLYHVVGYRKEVVMGNLQIAFSEKTDGERKEIARRFYRNFVDNFIETLKLLSASKKFIMQRMVIDEDLFTPLYKTGRKVQAHLGHNFNWELANAYIPYFVDFDFLVVYMPLKNKALDRLFIKLRSRTGSIMLPATNMRKEIIAFRDRQYLLTLVADQAPGSTTNAFWMNFFGCPTPFVRGPENGARLGNLPVLFCYLYKTSRGHYHAHIEMGAENPAELPKGELTRRYIRFLENTIRQHPDMYLWSHRRWKHGWKEEYTPLWIDEGPLPVTM